MKKVVDGWLMLTFDCVPFKVEDFASYARIDHDRLDLVHVRYNQHPPLTNHV